MTDLRKIALTHFAFKAKRYIQSPGNILEVISLNTDIIFKALGNPQITLADHNNADTLSSGGLHTHLLPEAFCLDRCLIVQTDW